MTALDCGFLTSFQLLIFAILAFAVLMRTGIYPPEKRGVNLDFDWTYRKALPALIAWISRRGGGVQLTGTEIEETLFQLAVFLRVLEPRRVRYQSAAGGDLRAAYLNGTDLLDQRRGISAVFGDCGDGRLLPCGMAVARGRADDDRGQLPPGLSGLVTSDYITEYFHLPHGDLFNNHNESSY